MPEAKVESRVCREGVQYDIVNNMEECGGRPVSHNMAICRQLVHLEFQVLYVEVRGANHSCCC